MRRALALVIAATGCVGGGHHPSMVLRADPSPAFPVTWDGRREPAKTAVAVAPPRPAPAPAPVEPERRAPPRRYGRIRNELVAVLELHSKLKGKDKDDVDPGYFGNQVRAAVKRHAPEAQVMTRENVLVMLQASGKTLADCEGECEVDTGRRLGADLVISGELVRVGSKLKLDLRMHETQSGQLLSGVTAEGKNVDELDGDLERAVATLVLP